MTLQDEARLSNEVVTSILELEACGYTFIVVGDVIRYMYDGDSPEPEYIRPRLTMIKDHHELAIAYLNNRSKPFNLTSYLIIASNKAIASAKSAEKRGDPKLARREWSRLNRLAAALADHIGEEPDGGMSWEEWIKSIQQEASHD